MPKKEKTQSNKSLLPLMFVLAGMLLVLVFFKFSYIFKEDKQTPSVVQTQLLQGLAQKLDIQPEIYEARYWDWKENGQRIPLMGHAFIMGTVNINGIGQYKELAGQDLDQVTFTNLQPIEETANKYFKSKGFKSSKENDQTTNSDVSKTKYVGFERREMRCLYRLSETTDPFGTFFCGLIDHDQWSEQTPFLPMFKKEFAEDQFTGFRVDKIEGKYATGAFYNSSMGYQWIAEKQGDQWKMVWNGNEPPLCSTIEPMGIPKSIYGICYDQ